MAPARAAKFVAVTARGYESAMRLGRCVSICLVAAGCRGTPAPSEPEPTPSVRIAPSTAAASASGAASVVPDERPKRVVEVPVDGAVLLAGKAYDDAALVEAARTIATGDPSERLYFRADADLTWDRVIRVIDRLKQGGIDKLGFLREGGAPLLFDFPHVSRGQLDEAVVVIGVEVSADGSVRVDGAPRPDDHAIAAHVREVLAKSPDARAVLLAHRGVRYGRVMQLYALLVEAGVKNPAFGVEPQPVP